jgi:hypothetical protein
MNYLAIILIIVIVVVVIIIENEICSYKLNMDNIYANRVSLKGFELKKLI